jgi:hypothetical protein
VTKLTGLFAFWLMAVLPLATASAHPTWAIAADPSGRIWFSDLEAVWRIDVDKSVHLVRPAVSGRHVHEIRLDGVGNLVGEELVYEPATQAYRAGIWAITPRGNQVWILAPTGAPPLGLGIWSDRSGNSFHVQWNNNDQARLLAFRRDSRGRVTRLLGSAADSRGFTPTVLYNASGFALAADGSGYFTDRASLYAYSAQRGATRIAAIRGAALRGIAIGAAGRLFLADASGRRVLRRNADGTFNTVMRAEPGWSPHGVALSADALFVLEFADYRRGAQGRLRIRKLDRQGTITPIASRPTP